MIDLDADIDIRARRAEYNEVNNIYKINMSVFNIAY